MIISFNFFFFSLSIHFMAEHIKHSPPAAVNIDIPISKKISKKSLPRQNNKKRNPQKKKNTKLIRPINSSQVDLPSTGTFPATIVSNLSYWLKNAHCTRQRCRPSFFFFFFFHFLIILFFYFIFRCSHFVIVTVPNRSGRNWDRRSDSIAEG